MLLILATSFAIRGHPIGGTFCAASCDRSLCSRLTPAAFGQPDRLRRQAHLYQFCFDIRGGFPPWTPAITDATGTFDRCTGLSGRVPRWGRNITKLAQCYRDCPGARGRFLPWPERCTDFAMCFTNATGMHGEIPAWPECAESLDSAFEGCTGATGIIPKWPESVKSVNYCYKGCTGLTGAWTDDPALLMPEEKLRNSPTSDYYRCYDVVTGCADAVRSLFWDKNWGGTIPRPE